MLLNSEQTLLKEFLDERVYKYNQFSFIETDPIQIPHQFNKKEDIEISGFLTATIAWGQRKSIIQNANKLMMLMDQSPHDFIMNYNQRELMKFNSFVHRTFNGLDCMFFISALRDLYRKHGGLEQVFSSKVKCTDNNIFYSINHFRELFLKTKHLSRSEKHVSSPLKNSSAKRLCMYLRWMVRKDKTGVDFGLWREIKPSQLCLPLDLHTGNVSRKLGLLKRKQNDWEAVLEVTNQLIQFDAKDPVKYDFALFGLGAFEKF